MSLPPGRPKEGSLPPGGKARSAKGAPICQWRDREEFKARVLEWAAKFDVKVHGLFVRPMRNKWASCSTAGTLSFNDELLGMERDLGDYVIVHELLHFSVPNHGKLWKSLMRAHLGEYEQLEARMKHAAHDNRSSRSSR
jgi:predicted metal-dependent hydrolase